MKRNPGNEVPPSVVMFILLCSCYAVLFTSSVLVAPWDMSLCCKWEPGLGNQACSGYVLYWENMLSYLASFVRALQGSVCTSVHTVKTRLGMILSQNCPRAWLWTEEARLVKQIYRSHSGQGKTIQVKRVRRGPYRQ